MNHPAALARDLLAWYADTARELPWRGLSDPYAIWISEIMLQQTQVKTVIPYFQRWMTLFPGVQDLADASEAQVLKAWEGLGYYSRARHLHAAARIIRDHHGGVFPRTWEAVRGLPGIGDYTAGAILSIAHGLAFPAVDGNALRVVSRLALLREDIAKPTARRQVTAWVTRLLEEVTNPGDLNQAIFDLGATCCTPHSPNCQGCPLARHCRAWAAGEAESLPLKSGGRPPKDLVLASALIQDNRQVLLQRRASPGIWGGLWAPPTIEWPEVDPSRLAESYSQAERLFHVAGWPLELGSLLTVIPHTLTHRRLTIAVFEARLKGAGPEDLPSAWVPADQEHELGMPVPFQRLFRLLDAGPLFRSGHGGPHAPPVRLI
ncbi:MAG: A/G-specific adenine glycosylase [Candidatus Sericytochromatia bacterium]|nr:A/G-specific adenine glycosylase [Candidatus Sericytochromatia bacterium]